MVERDEKKETCSSNCRWFGRYIYHGFRDFFRFHRHEEVEMRPVDYASWIQLFMAKFLLEVCGSAGAIWGCSDIFGWRTAETNEVWRILSLVVFGIFLLRFWWHSKHYLEHDREFPPIKFKHRRLHKLPFLQIFSASLVLEVLGAAGAVWGPAEAMTWRTPDNRLEWQIVSGVVGIVFLMRWVVNIMTYCLCLKSFMEKRPLLGQFLGWVEVLGSRFLLVVCGAVGACWGFTEIVTLRTPETNHLWRPISYSVGLLFIIRWILQTFEYATEGWDKEDLPPPDESSRQLKTSDSPSVVEDLELTNTPQSPTDESLP